MRSHDRGYTEGQRSIDRATTTTSLICLGTQQYQVYRIKHSKIDTLEGRYFSGAM